MAYYEYVLTDLQGVAYGELTQADSRTVTLSHLRVPTASAVIPMWHARAADVLANDCLLKVYRQPAQNGSSKQLIFHGPVVSVDENAADDAQTIQLNAAGPFWRLTKRLIPASLAYDGAGKALGLTFAGDLGSGAQTLLANTNAIQYTGISAGTYAASISGTYGPVVAKTMADAIAELSTGVGSFEYSFTPTEATNVAQAFPQIASFNVGPASSFSTARPDAVFEWGTARANVESYQRTISRDGLLTRQWMTVDGWPDATVTGKFLRSRDGSPQISTRGLFEEVVDNGGILDDALRDGVMDYNLAVRKNPRQLITFKPAINAKPRIFEDYNVGDTVRARAESRGTLRFDGTFRVWGAVITLDSNGNEAVELELVVP